LRALEGSEIEIMFQYSFINSIYIVLMLWHTFLFLGLRPVGVLPPVSFLLPVFFL
jgi:hypothetical protein